jgi:hypothetical protein
VVLNRLCRQIPRTSSRSRWRAPSGSTGQARSSTKGEASLRRHLQNEAQGEEGGGSSDYVPEDRSKDLQLKAAIDILHGVKIASNAKPKDTKPIKGAGAREPEGNPNEVSRNGAFARDTSALFSKLNPRMPIPTKPPGYNGIMPPGIPE